MDRQEIEELRGKVSCGALLERDGWQMDLTQSTRRAVKYRRGEGEIVIVIHDGKGRFDPLSDATGDVFGLAEHLGAKGFAEALTRVAEAEGLVLAASAWTHPSCNCPPESLDSRWCRRLPRPGSATWHYLADERHLPEAIIHAAVVGGVIREGPYGSMWAAHRDTGDQVIGWEERGPAWQDFATGGTKELFRIGALDPLRTCMAEAAIDAMSLAALEGPATDRLYVSTGGGWSPTTDAAINGGFRNPHYGLAPGNDEKPGLWLVGDQGVYIMSNGKLAEDARPLVIYAEECHPVGNPDWWHYKQRHFGGDGGVEFLDAEELLRIINGLPSATHLSIALTETSITLSAIRR